MVLGDTHIYSDEKADHALVAREQIKRMNQTYSFPEFRLNKKLCSLEDLNILKSSDLEIVDYTCCDALKTRMIA